MPVVLRSSTALSTFPKQVADYFMAVSPVGDELVACAITALDDVATDSHHARDLHLLRALRRERKGRVEGTAMVRTVLDEARPVGVRAFALYESSRTHAVQIGELGDIALDEDEDILLRRAAIAGLRGRPDADGMSLVRHPKIAASRLRWVAAWAAAS
ncbi:MAG: hypothetical protein ACT4PI_07450 [Actinomycetota bacterium]